LLEESSTMQETDDGTRVAVDDTLADDVEEQHMQTMKARQKCVLFVATKKEAKKSKQANKK